MELIEVKQNWKDDLFRVDMTLGNICNYKCWYCFTGCNEGNLKWPNFDIIIKNTAYMLDYYIKNTNKKKFDFHIMGGEVTHWKYFIDFIEYFKTRYDCIFTLTTNASKKMSWWKSAVKYLDYVIISVHHQYSDINHICEVADYLYENRVIVTTSVLMDPNAWDKCIDIVEKLKQSKKSWSIKYSEIVQQDISYTDEQKQILNKLRARKVNPIFFLMNNKSYLSKVKVIDSNKKIHRFEDHELIFRRLNNFKNWKCNVGVDWISIKPTGKLVGICGNPLFNNTEYNIFDSNFIENFNPTIEPSICYQDGCWCTFESNMNKRKILS